MFTYPDPNHYYLRSALPRPRHRERWYRSPILWLGVAMFAASLGGCIVTILLALEHADTPLSVEGERLLNVPAAHAEYAPPAGDGP